ncbi:MAG TPA: PepSY domain-containing protein [Candidatus Copromorpha excrementavium]|uniref:PepSY domain-containing protein n=1 Tax=Candidatus Allocopromorpha excrementavium TaxID=2840741 RepID=A0A9D1HDK1_9FIRM|nr:PepSY domain-containing protein [Candidatus Copromorpha excrementavium]
MENKNTENKNMENLNAENAVEKGGKGKGKKKGVIAAVIVAAVVVIALIACWFMGVIGGISEAEAKEIAYGQVQGATDDGSASVIKEFDDGRMTYDIQIVHDNTIYEFSILARNGDIVNTDMESINQGGSAVNGQSNTSQTAPSSDIGVDKAKEIALAQVSGAAASDITKANADMDDGRYVYEVEIVYDQMDYDFEIDAATGEIISQTSESVYD